MTRRYDPLCVDGLHDTFPGSRRRRSGGAAAWRRIRCQRRNRLGESHPRACRSTTGCWRRTCWASVSRPRWSTSPTAGACGSGTSPASARCSASTPRISSATRWAPSTCSTDLTSQRPVLPVRSAVTICGGGEIQKNRHTTALYDYDATVEAMRAIVEALFFDPAYPADEDVCAAGATSPASRPGPGSRWRRPGFAVPAWRRRPTPSSKRAYERITVPVLVVEGAGDKLLPPGGRPRSPGRSPAPAPPSIDRRRALPADRAARGAHRRGC